MTRKIFLSIIFVSLITFLSCMLIMTAAAGNYFNEKLLHELETEAVYVAAGVEASGEGFLRNIEESNRVTLISPDGDVLYDTAVNAGDLDSHADREEVMQAIKDGMGSAVRYSGTMDSDELYFAKRLEGGDIVRVSREQYTFGDVLKRILSPSAVLLFPLMILSIALAVALSKSIVRPINSIDIEKPQADKAYPELSPLLHKISRQNGLIRRQMKDLKQKQVEFSTVTEHMSEGLIMLSDKGEVLSCNNSAQQQLNTQAAVPGTDIFALCPDEDFETVVRNALQGERGVHMFRQGGRIYQLFATPVIYNMKKSGAVLLILDATEREQSETLRREFTSNVSHELKTPLTTIYGVSELLISGMVKDEDKERFVRTIHGESGRMISLVEDIIKLSRLDERSFSQEKEECDLYELAEAAVESLSVAASSNGITVKLRGERATVSGIKTILSEMIYNLCDNAVKYNKPDGSVTVSVQGGDHPELSVSDTGIGIPSEHMDRIFERFYRVDKSHSRDIGGTGLGLSIVKHGAAYHNAQISVKSRENMGTVITVKF